MLYRFSHAAIGRKLATAISALFLYLAPSNSLAGQRQQNKQEKRVAQSPDQYTPPYMPLLPGPLTTERIDIDSIPIEIEEASPELGTYEGRMQIDEHGISVKIYAGKDSSGPYSLVLETIVEGPDGAPENVIANSATMRDGSTSIIETDTKLIVLPTSLPEQFNYLQGPAYVVLSINPESQGNANKAYFTKGTEIHFPPREGKDLVGRVLVTKNVACTGIETCMAVPHVVANEAASLRTEQIRRFTQFAFEEVTRAMQSGTCEDIERYPLVAIERLEQELASDRTAGETRGNHAIPASAPADAEKAEQEAYKELKEDLPSYIRDNCRPRTDSMAYSAVVPDLVVPFTENTIQQTEKPSEKNPETLKPAPAMKSPQIPESRPAYPSTQPDQEEAGAWYQNPWVITGIVSGTALLATSAGAAVYLMTRDDKTQVTQQHIGKPSIDPWDNHDNGN
jgi:hypothetical protein